MVITRKFFAFFLILLPITLISGPAIPDITITLSAIIFLIYLIYNKNIKYLSEYNWFKISIFFWLYLLLASLLSNKEDKTVK